MSSHKTDLLGLRPLAAEMHLLRSGDLRSGSFLLDETIDLDDRFEVAIRVLYPGYKPVTRLH
jgi:hypothetical protein